MLPIHGALIEYPLKATIRRGKPMLVSGAGVYAFECLQSREAVVDVVVFEVEIKIVVSRDWAGDLYGRQDATCPDTLACNYWECGGACLKINQRSRLQMTRLGRVGDFGESLCAVVEGVAGVEVANLDRQRGFSCRQLGGCGCRLWWLAQLAVATKSE